MNGKKSHFDKPTTRYEGILISLGEVVNAAAIGAEIRSSRRICCEIYMPSDTARNLEIGAKFTYSLADSHHLFYNAALTGRNQSGYQEIPDEQLCRMERYIYPKNAIKVFFCKVKEISKKKCKDEFGTVEIKKIEGKIKFDKKLKDGSPLGRGDPLLDTMVHLTRLDLAEGKEKKRLRKLIIKLLKSADESPIKEKLKKALEK